MNVHLILLSLDTLEFARKLRNANRQYFYYSKYITKAQHRAWFDKLNYLFFLILADFVLVGTTSLKLTDEGYELGNIIIERDSRGKGILEEAFSQILKTIDQDKKQLFLSVLETNVHAIKAYEKLGFKKHKIIDKNQVQYVYKPSYRNHSNI